MKDAKGTEIPVSRSQTKRLREYLKLVAPPARRRGVRVRRCTCRSRPRLASAIDQRRVRGVPDAPRRDVDDRAARAMMQQISVWRDELVAWFKTLVLGRRLRDAHRDVRVPGGARRRPEHGADARGPGPPDRQQARLPGRATPRRGDIVMLYYPLNPDKSFVKRVIAEEGDTVRIVDGRVYVNDVPMHDDFVAAGVSQPRRLRPAR